MTKSKATERITPAQETSKGIMINEDAATSKGKATKLPTTTGKGKGKRPTSARKTITLDPNIPAWPRGFYRAVHVPPKVTSDTDSQAQGEALDTDSHTNGVTALTGSPFYLPLCLYFLYLEFEAKHGQYFAKRNKTGEKTKKRRPEDCLMHSTQPIQIKKLRALKGGLWQTAEPFGELDPARLTAQRGNFQPRFPKSSPQPPKSKSNTHTTQLTPDPIDPCLRGTQTSPGLTKIGHLITYSFKNDVKRSIIGQSSHFKFCGSNGGPSRAHRLSWRVADFVRWRVANFVSWRFANFVRWRFANFLGESPTGHFAR
uniref:Uncharacterized protein n=1 Tax=Solanum tuberosum TaxID=4113 RepID=M1DJ98_SOLTU